MPPLAIGKEPSLGIGGCPGTVLGTLITGVNHRARPPRMLKDSLRKLKLTLTCRESSLLP